MNGSKYRFYVVLCLVFVFTNLTGCVIPARGVKKPISLNDIVVQIRSTLTQHVTTTIDTPSAQDTPPPQERTEPSLVETQKDKISIFLHKGLPSSLISGINLDEYQPTDNNTDAEIIIGMGPDAESGTTRATANWVYVLAAPFYTITDDISYDTLQAFWQGNRNSIGDFSKIVLEQTTEEAMSEILGSPDAESIQVITQEGIEEIALSDHASLVIMPFEMLNKHWKVIRVDGKAPINTDFNPDEYSLSLPIWIESSLENLSIELPESNYDQDLRTVLVMTGVTALTRATAYQMAVRGEQFPGQDIREWLTSADLTHISNEVPFAANCPYPDPVQEDLIFCSDPQRIELLSYVGADIIELTGNHLLDYGLSAIELTLSMYQERGLETYAGGWDLADAQSPLTLTHNGNQIAFIGCNTIGPPNVWAGDSKPGAAACGDFMWMINEITKLREAGYLPIVTLQYAEDYTAYPSSQMTAHFEQLGEAGAIVVNGSQAHTPKMMSFYNDSFLHFGLGNLFFDQMEVYSGDTLLSGTRQEFIDRLMIYDGKLVSIELLTAMLEDYARPRPMTATERESFLSRIFSVALND